MKTIVATAITSEELTQVWLEIIENYSSILWADINDERLQITVIYETQEEITRREHEVEAEFLKKSGVKEIKKRKQPTVRELNAKAEKLCLFNLAIERVEGVYQIINNYAKNELIYSCKTATGISRQLTKFYWDKQISSLQDNGLIAR